MPKLMPRPDGPILDAGCGAGGFVAAAAAQGIDACGADIALRWLVIAAKRLDELGLRAELVCADIAAPPFPDGRFAAVAAVDLLEHVEDADRTLASLARVASANAPIYVAAANRYTLAPYPLAALWGVGYLPRSLRRRYVTARRGFDTLRHATLLSPGGLRQRLRRCGFKRIEVAALDVPAARRSGLGGFQKRILPLYSHLRRMPVLGRILVSVGPAFEITARGPSGPGTATFPARAQ